MQHVWPREIYTRMTGFIFWIKDFIKQKFMKFLIYFVTGGEINLTKGIFLLSFSQTVTPGSLFSSAKK